MISDQVNGPFWVDIILYANILKVSFYNFY